jgi:hypothetical protein
MRLVHQQYLPFLGVLVAGRHLFSITKISGEALKTRELLPHNSPGIAEYVTRYGRKS